jgi:hypothetical protein
MQPPRTRPTSRFSHLAQITEYLTAEALVMRKNQNLRFRGVRVDRQFFHSQKTTVFSRCVDPNCLSSA